MGRTKEAHRGSDKKARHPKPGVTGVSRHWWKDRMRWERSGKARRGNPRIHCGEHMRPLGGRMYRCDRCAATKSLEVS